MRLRARKRKTDFALSADLFLMQLRVKLQKQRIN